MATGWLRVAQGLQKVAHAAAVQTGNEAAKTATRVAQHGIELALSAQTSLKQSILEQHVTQRNSHKKSENVSTNDKNGSDSSIQNDQVAPTITTMTSMNAGTYQTPTNPLAQQNEIGTSLSSSNPLLGNNEFPKKSIASSDDHMVATPTLTTLNEPIRSSTEENQSTLPPTRTTESFDPQSITHITEGRAVPATRWGRALGFANLGLGLAWGTVAEGARRLVTVDDGTTSSASSSSSSSAVLSDSNADRLATSLCRMRGAALKMGQMLSIQDESLLPPPLVRALRRVRQGAEAMPQQQLDGQLQSALGDDWRMRFVDFDIRPFAAASIGQCHRATVRSSFHNGTSVLRNVVVKVQYPGVARSIESDLRNLAMLVSWSGLAPKGLFIENVIRVGQEELRVECDYRREMENQQRIQKLVTSDSVLCDNHFVVPDVFEELTTDQVITSEYLPGGTIEKALYTADQDERNRIGRTILYLTMKELFDWRFMQTDPNWGNFLYDVGSQTTGLIDFGAAREYSKQFVDGYLRIVWASANQDENTLMEQSHKMGFLTGDENTQMLRAHKLSGFTVGEPFWDDKPFDFRGSSISQRMGEHTAVFLRHRLTPPPEEVYTLHRKLAGAYMLCIKLGAVVQARDMLQNIVRNHQFDDGMENPLTVK